MTVLDSLNPVRIFYSYSHKDECFKERLLTHLRILEHQRIIRGWHDRLIGAGEDWAGEIDAHLEEADVILLLISADFLASDYCYDREMKRSLERHDAGDACVIPIILQPCLWQQAPFAHLQALPEDGSPVATWATPEEAWAKIADGIVLAISRLRKNKLGLGGPVAPRRVIIRAKGIPNEVYCVLGGKADLGRSVLCDFSLPQAPGQISNRHALLRFERSQECFVIRDLGSQNGTYLDGRRVRGEQILSNGSKVDLGHALAFLFYYEPRDPAAGGSLLFHSGQGIEVGCYAIAPNGRLRIGNGREDVGRLSFLPSGFTLGMLVQRGDTVRLVECDASSTPLQEERLTDGMELSLTTHVLNFSVR